MQGENLSDLLLWLWQPLHLSFLALPGEPVLVLHDAHCAGVLAPGLGSPSDSVVQLFAVQDV